MIKLRFLRITHAGGTVYNAGEVAAFHAPVARAILAAGHAVDVDAPLADTACEQEPVETATT